MGEVKSDIEIARKAKMKPIQEILDGINVPDKQEAYSPIGRYMAKIKSDYLIYTGSYFYKPNKDAIDYLNDKIMPKNFKLIIKIRNNY